MTIAFSLGILRYVVADAQSIPGAGSTSIKHPLRWAGGFAASGVIVLATLVVAVLLRSEPRSLTQKASIVILAVGAVMTVVAISLVRK